LQAFDIRFLPFEIGPIPLTEPNGETLEAHPNDTSNARMGPIGNLWDIMGYNGRQWECLALLGFYWGVTGPHSPQLSTKKAAKMAAKH